MRLVGSVGADKNQVRQRLGIKPGDKIELDLPSRWAGVRKAAQLLAGRSQKLPRLHWFAPWLGGETFVSFDKKAVTLLAAQGLQAKLL